MKTDTWSDSEGFGRKVEVEPGVFSVKGPDNEDHATMCPFIRHKGILPCECDATRREFGKDQHGNRTEWYRRWVRWQEARSANILREQWPLKWPVTGPDGDPWVPGVDFNDDEPEEPVAFTLGQSVTIVGTDYDGLHGRIQAVDPQHTSYDYHVQMPMNGNIYGFRKGQLRVRR